MRQHTAIHGAMVNDASMNATWPVASAAMSTCTATARGQEKENTVKMLHSFPCLQFTWFTCADSISQRVCRSSFRPRSQQKAAIVGLVVNYCRSWRSSNDSLMQGVKRLPPAITASIADANIIFRALALNAASPWPLHLLLPGWGSYCRSRRKSNHSFLGHRRWMSTLFSTQ